VISDGLRGRTPASYRPGGAEYRGDFHLPTLLHTHEPLDLVMIMLGTNDIYSNMPMHHIWWGLRRLVEIVRTHPFGHEDSPRPEVLVIAPPTFTGGKFLGIDEAMAQESRKMGAMVADFAKELDVPFFDAATVAHAEAGDGLHLEASASRALGEALQTPVKALLNL
jgi:lysophospholipase L1-like esterase